MNPTVWRLNQRKSQPVRYTAPGLVWLRLTGVDFTTTIFRARRASGQFCTHHTGSFESQDWLTSTQGAVWVMNPLLLDT